RHTRFSRDWSSDVCSSDLLGTSWLRDTRRNALFSTDFFCADLVRQEGGEPFRRSVDDAPSDADIRANVLAKFDWLARARLNEIQIGRASCRESPKMDM